MGIGAGIGVSASGAHGRRGAIKAIAGPDGNRTVVLAEAHPEDGLAVPIGESAGYATIELMAV